MNCKRCAEKIKMITGLRIDYELCRYCQAKVGEYLLESIQRKMTSRSR